MGLKLITPPTEEPLTLPEVKEYLRIDAAEASFDNILTGLIIAAREFCEIFQNRAYITQTWELTLDIFPKMPLKLPKPPLKTVNSIKYIDYLGAETVWDPSNYLVDEKSEPGRIAFSYQITWPSVTLQPINAVKINFDAGYGAALDVPENVKMAMKLYIAHRFENPDSEEVPTVVELLLWSDRMVPL